MTIQSAASVILKVCAAISVLLVGGEFAASPAAPVSFPIGDASFKCITEMTHVRHFYVDNLAGDLAGTVKVAQAATASAVTSRRARSSTWSATTVTAAIQSPLLAP
jgi:hypothetical protein